MTKTIGDNDRIYSLIIVLNVKIVTNVRCGLFNITNLSHLTMLLSHIPYGCLQDCDYKKKNLTKQLFYARKKVSIV